MRPAPTPHTVSVDCPPGRLEGTLLLPGGRARPPPRLLDARQRVHAYSNSSHTEALMSRKPPASWKDRRIRAGIVFLVMSGIAVLALLVVAPSARAAGGVGTVECRAVQIDAQNAVRHLGQPKNHGQVVSTAANVVSAAEEAGQIGKGCAGCIVRQFANRVPLDEQTQCGPDCPAGFQAVATGCGEVRVLCLQLDSACSVAGVDCCAACLCTDQACCTANPACELALPGGGFAPCGPTPPECIGPGNFVCGGPATCCFEP